jgi:hypothetical protein
MQWNIQVSVITVMRISFRTFHDSFSPYDFPIFPPRYLWSECINYVKVENTVRWLRNEQMWTVCSLSTERTRRQ